MEDDSIQATIRQLGPSLIPPVGVHTGILGGPMFDSLADRIRQDDGPPVKTSVRLIRMAMVVLVAVVLFGGLYMVVQHLE